MDLRSNIALVAALGMTAATATACSGATETELFADARQSDRATEPVAGSSNDAPSSGGGSGSTAGGGASTSGGSGTEDEEGADNDGKDAEEPPAPPAPTCAAESEPNDDDAAADTFTDCFSGTLKREDLDHAKTVAPATATKISIKRTESGGGVWYRVFVNGAPLPAFDDEAPGYIPTVPNATYVFQMSPVRGGNANRTYTLHVTFE